MILQTATQTNFLNLPFIEEQIFLNPPFITEQTTEQNSIYNIAYILKIKLTRKIKRQFDRLKHINIDQTKLQFYTNQADLLIAKIELLFDYKQRIGEIKQLIIKKIIQDIQFLVSKNMLLHESDNIQVSSGFCNFNLFYQHIINSFQQNMVEYLQQKNIINAQYVQILHDFYYKNHKEIKRLEKEIKQLKKVVTKLKKI